MFLNEDVSPSTQSTCNAKMGELQVVRERELITYFSGTKLVLRMKRSTHSLHENAADGTASRRDNAEQDEAELTGSAEIGEDTGSAEIGSLACTQAYAAGPALLFYQCIWTSLNNQTGCVESTNQFIL